MNDDEKFGGIKIEKMAPSLRLYDGPPIKYKMKFDGWYQTVRNKRTHMKCGHPWPRICTCMWNEPPRKIVVHLD